MEKRVFYGRQLNAVDAKGRVSLPAELRQVIERRAQQAAARSGEQFNEKEVFVARHPTLPCLRAFDTGHEAALLDDAAKLVAGLPPEEQVAALEAAQADLYGSLAKVSLDGPGRMVIPPTMRRRAGIDGTALFVGAGNVFQVWNPDTYLAHAATSQAAREHVEDLIAEREGRV